MDKSRQNGRLAAKVPGGHFTPDVSPRRAYHLACLGLFLVLTAHLSFAADETYDGFSMTANPNGAWSYGYSTSLGGALVLYQGKSFNVFSAQGLQGFDLWRPEPPLCGDELSPSVGRNAGTVRTLGSTVYPFATLNIHPGCGGEYSVVRWTAAQSGTFSVRGIFRATDSNTHGTDVHVRLNSVTPLFDANLASGDSVPFELERQFSQGDVLDFIVGPGGDPISDNTAFWAKITLQEPPHSLTFYVPDGDVAGLVAAINAANAVPGPHVINLAPNGNYVLTEVVETPREYNSPGAVGLPAIRRTVTINGNGATIQRSTAPGTPDFALLDVSGRTAICGMPFCWTNPVLTLNQVTLTGGSRSALHLNNATALVQSCTITANTGGGIRNMGGYLTVLNSTISKNDGGNWGGGGVLAFGFSAAPDAPTTKISFSTLYENQSIAGDSISTGYTYAGSFVVKNSILANPTRASRIGYTCWQHYAGAIVSAGYNIVPDTSCGFASAGDIVVANLTLGPLADNEGLTPTHMPLTGSPAVDAIPVGACTDAKGNPVATDQRGLARPQGRACDIGSVDTAADPSAPLISANVAGTLGTGGWYRSAVTVTWSVQDPESGIAWSAGCAPVTLTEDTSGVSLTCSAVNGSGLSASSDVVVKIDKTPPVLAGTRSPLPNAAGWNNTDVAVQFTCVDALSGVASFNSGAVLSSDGANQSVAGACADLAGNTATAAVGGINIDKTRPITSNVSVDPNPAPVNTAMTLAASLSDAGGSGLAGVEYTLDGGAASSLGTASGTSAQVSGSLPPFPEAGVHAVCLRVTDLAGNTSNDECLFLPVYDPAGGFVTGGGWILSPAGAFASDPGLTGKASFGFVSKYVQGATGPTGDTQFQFQVANLKFKSTQYDWLVVSGARAQYKGSGTINGVGDFGFLLTAIDGQIAGGGGLDRFRIKIWDKASGLVVYDNQSGADDNSNATTELGGGSIIIHKQ